MSTTKAIEIKDKSARIYLIMALIFIGIFSTITILSLFVSALNF